VLFAAALAAVFLAPAAVASSRDPVEVVVGLEPPPLATAMHRSLALRPAAKAGKLDLASATSTAYVARLARLQDALATRIVRSIPGASVRWRYRVVLDAIAVVVPRDRLGEVSSIPGVAEVYPNVSYRPLLDTSPEQIGADTLWGPDMSTAGQGVKIAILDEGINPQHPFFSASGYVYPAGYPKGDPRYTTPKIVAARAFAPPGATWKFAPLPYDPVNSDHGDHVAGIAAGDFTPGAVAGRGPLKGVAPKAYLGNYKVLTVPTPGDGIDGNNPEIAAAIEAAVADGMDVINLSIGEAEIQPSRDVVDAAIGAAAQAGVVTTVAAGNDFDQMGRGSINSPANAPAAIAAAAASKTDLMAYFSSSGPTPIGLLMKPDVTAPGVSILSALPPREGTWGTESGTSMAAPHVAGGAALLRERHPTWTAEQIKSALVLTGDPVYIDPSHTTEAPTTREGGGMIDLPKADNPLVFADPTGLSFGLMKPGTTATEPIALTDAGGGAGDWTVAVQPQQGFGGVSVSAAATVTVPGTIAVVATLAANAPEVDATGFIVLQRGTDTRRIPYWLRVERPRLAPAKQTLTKPGIYAGTTRGQPSRVISYRYPDDPRGSGLTNTLRGPEQVFSFRLTRKVANFGVVLLSQGNRVHVTPRVVADGDENRLTGYPGLPLDINPYLTTFGQPEAVAGAVLPGTGTYDVVFDTTSAASAGPFSFRFWVDDRTPPSVRLLTQSVEPATALTLSVTDAGSGVDTATLSVTIDGRAVDASYDPATGQAKVDLSSRVVPGRHQLTFVVSDYQEEKNMEDVVGILPNTTTLRTAFTVR